MQKCKKFSKFQHAAGGLKQYSVEINAIGYETKLTLPDCYYGIPIWSRIPIFKKKKKSELFLHFLTAHYSPFL